MSDESKVVHEWKDSPGSGGECSMRIVRDTNGPGGLLQEPDVVTGRWETWQMLPGSVVDELARLTARCKRLEEANANNLEGWRQNVAGLNRKIARLEAALKEYAPILEAIDQTPEVRHIGRALRAALEDK